ncbi:IS110 family transposase, partial [Heyndrickxia sporothermodurans]|uniref:IS110 family transposase n=1 Tax=Heyndrickxia sporothermodurans TaxID=46224 RepID=UPI001FD406AE
AQSISGRITAPNFWRRINGLQKQIVNDTSHGIVKFAKEHKCDVIVFEYLDQMKMPKGFWGAKKLRFKLRYWRKKGIQNKVEEMAHYLGMRISRINARNTSALAFDGSGKVQRNAKKDLATFTTGKVYHADLQASYNIGARYFIRAIQISHGNSLLRHAGLHLAEASSGKWKGQIVISKRGRSRLRRFLYLATMSLVVNNPEFKAIHSHNVRVKKIKKMKSIMKLIGKLARIIVGIARRNESYCPNKVQVLAA